MAIVAFAGAWGPGVNAPIYKSKDLGVTWRRVAQIPQPPGGDITGPGDQKVAYDAAGKLYVAELGLDEGATTGSGLLNYIYREVGQPDDPLRPGASYGDDQPHIAVDALASTSCSGMVYSPWLNSKVAQSNAVVSVDQGTTVTNSVVGDIDRFMNRTTRIAIGTAGQAFIVYKTREGLAAGTKFEYAHYLVKRSDDCGRTWAALGSDGVSITGKNQVETYFTDAFGNEQKGMVARSRSSDAWIATGPSGEVCVAYVNVDASGLSQIYVARSANGGASWNSTRITDGTHNASYPEIALTANGTIGVLYIDYDDSGSETIFQHKFARLRTQATGWETVLLQQMQPSKYANGQPNYLWGDYEGLTSIDATFVGVFTGESVGRVTPQLAPIFFTESG